MWGYDCALGKEAYFLGMNVIVNKEKTIKIGMKEQLQEETTPFGEAIHGSITLTDQKKKLELNDNAEKIDKEKSEFFHSVTAKIFSQ